MTDLRSRDDVAGLVRPRRGAHRAASGRVAALLPLLLVLGAVAVLAVGVALVVVLSRPPDVAGAEAAGSPVATAPAPVAPSTPATPSTPSAPSTTGDAAAAGSDGSAASAGTAPGEEAAATGEDAGDQAGPAGATDPDADAGAQVDTDVPVVVLNATRTSGLAAQTAEELEREGWSVSSTGNARDGDVAVTVVRFPDAGLEATARAVADSLGGGPVYAVLDEGADEGVITVLAGPDRDG